MSRSDDPVLLCKDDGVARIRFNRPETLNAISTEMAECFLAVCSEVANDFDVRAIVVSGEGRAFMAGGDLSQFSQDFANASATAQSMMVPMNKALAVLGALPAPVIACLHGAVAGAGLSVAMACDLAIASVDTKFSFAYTRVGASPDVGGSWFLPRIVGLRRAMEIALLGETFDADRALTLGLVNQVVSTSQLDEVTTALACCLAHGPTLSYGATKRLLRASFDRSLDDQLCEELSAFQFCATTNDFVEAVSAFVEKRKNAGFSGT